MASEKIDKKNSGSDSPSPLFLPSLHAGSLGDLTVRLSFSSFGRVTSISAFLIGGCEERPTQKAHPPYHSGVNFSTRLLACLGFNDGPMMGHRRRFPICQAKPSDVTRPSHDGVL